MIYAWDWFENHDARSKIVQWIEIIKVRAVGTIGVQTAADVVRDFSTMNEGTKPTALKLYHHSTVESDLSIHLSWNLETMRVQKSPLGLRIADAIGDLGMVNHSVWIEDAIIQ